MEDRTCSIEGCGLSGKLTRGWCPSHYSRWRRHGDPLAGRGPNAVGRICRVDECSDHARARGWCRSHYQRWKAHGSPELGTDARRFSPEDRWAAWTDRRGECLIWTGTVDGRGYGQLMVDGRRMNAHAYAWVRSRGPIPSGVVIDHRFHCDTGCVEVAHLRLATREENGWNRKGPNSDSTTGVRNVSFTKGKYRVQVTRHGVRYCRYSFDTLAEAATVASELRSQLFGEFAGRG